MKFNLDSEAINYIKITYKDKQGFAHCIKTAVRFMNTFEILTSAKIESDLSIDTPQDIDIAIACNNGLYKAKSNLIKTERENPYILFSIKKPEEISYQQNREFFRVKLQESANIIFENDNNQITKISALTYDISANGVRIELENNFSFPERVRILLLLPKKTIDVKAKYIRTDNDDGIIKVSFQFENIAENDLNYISQVCFKKQLEERRKNLL